MASNRDHNSKVLDELLSLITPESQELTDMRMRLAAKIYHAMKAKGWNQKEFAKNMGKYDSEISKWLSGTHNFESETLFAIEKILNIRLLDLGSSTVLKIEYNAPSLPSTRQYIDEIGGLQPTNVSVEYHEVKRSI